MEITISSLIKKLEEIKKKDGDLVVCLSDEQASLFVPLLENCGSVDVVEAGKKEDGVYTNRFAEHSNKIVVIQWSC